MPILKISRTADEEKELSKNIIKILAVNNVDKDKAVNHLLGQGIDKKNVDGAISELKSEGTLTEE